MNDAIPPPVHSPEPRVLLPTVVALVLLAVLAMATGLASCAATEGRLTYAQDDAYIHMAIAKNVAQHGVWGVHADRFTSSSSSPLWTALLAFVFRVGGVHDAVPLALNLACAFASVILFGSVLRGQRVPTSASVVWLVVFIAAVPLIPLAWVGMEASLQVALTLFCAWRCQRLTPEQAVPAREIAVLCGAAALLVATRYEGLFVLAGCVAVLALNGHRRLAVLLLASGVVPVLAIGLWNWSHGWYFLPASIVMKRALFLRIGDGSFAQELTASFRTLRMPLALPLLALAALAALVALSPFRQPRPFLRGGIVIFLVAAALHTFAARFGVFFRYEAYLFALGLLAMIPVMPHLAAFLNGRTQRGGWRDGALLAATAAAACALLIYAISGNLLTPAATTNIFQQQRQMAAFLSGYYDGQVIAMNDIGAASYYSNANVLDLSGLGSLEVAHLRLQTLEPQSFQSLADQAGRPAIAIVYESWFPPGSDRDAAWRRVATWTIPHNIVCGDAMVSFFAKSDGASELARRLREFAPRLPPGVIVNNDSGF